MKKLLSTTIAVGIFAATGLTPAAFADVAASALPSLNNATNADVTIGNSNDMNIQIQGGQGGVGVLNWNSYNVGKDASVNYEFSAHNQTALNKVSATGGLSQIYGKITSSGCAGCGYDATGKVILINPNGVLFGDGANVNLNSFTVSTFDGTFDKNTNTMNFDRNGKTSDYGILVMEGAQIHGDKAVNLVSDNVAQYAGSKITTSIAPNANGNTASLGKVKIVTADGVNFAYYNNGAVKGIDGVKTSADKMTIALNGDITAGNIDLRNYSNNAESQINLNGATLKAVKAVSGNDGNIWLTALNNIILDKAKLETTNYSADAAAVDKGNIEIVAGKKVSVSGSDIDAVGKVNFLSDGYDVVIDSTTIDTAKDVTVKAANIASIQNGSAVSAKNLTMDAGARAQVVSSGVGADDIVITGADVWTNNANLKANNNIKATATKGYVLAEATTVEAKKVTLDAATDVQGSIDTKESQTNIKAGNNIDVTLSNVGNRNNGLVAQAGKNVTIKTDGTLSVSKLVAENGDMTITADKVIAGLPYTSEEKIPNGDTSERSYIYVKNGKFTSNTANDSYTVSDSDTLTADGKYEQRHHIEYGNGAEKILLITNRPYVAPPAPPVVQPTPEVEQTDVDEQQAAMLNKLPRQPQTMSNVTNIADGRTTFVDVFAAASQIEIVEDEEE